MLKKVFQIGIVLTLLVGMLGFAIPTYASAPQNYTVLVGSDNTFKGASIMSFFPQNIIIHVGDTVTWQSNSHEPHTVTFLAGGAFPPLLIPAPAGYNALLQVNPLIFFPIAPPGGLYDGTTYANSGWMSIDPEGFETYSLTFTQAGTFDYICAIHGQMMMGSVQVVGADESAQTPAEVQAQAKVELKAAWLQVPLALAKASAQIVPPRKNSDGKLTHTITMGYESGNIAILGFFPEKDTVHPGDTVVWKMPDSGMAPHTVTFYNGEPDKPLFIMDVYQGEPIALVNNEVLFPSLTVLQGIPLNSTDYFNSGILDPSIQDFSLKVGDISGTLEYDCVIHDSSGMNGSLFVVPSGGD